jgi:hypothetical protein
VVDGRAGLVITVGIDKAADTDRMTAGGKVESRTVAVPSPGTQAMLRGATALPRLTV